MPIGDVQSLRVLHGSARLGGVYVFDVLFVPNSRDPYSNVCACGLPGDGIQAAFVKSPPPTPLNVNLSAVRTRPVQSIAGSKMNPSAAAMNGVGHSALLMTPPVYRQSICHQLIRWPA